MQLFIIRFIDPQKQTTYWPRNFGFGVHKHAETLDGAERFQSQIDAQRRLNGYVYPPAFWESERKHAEKMRQHFKGWRYEVIPLESADD